MPFATVILDGGLDLQTAPVAVTPGRLTACDNFEVDRNAGYKRVDGYERYDGGPSPSTSDCIAFRVAGVPASTVIGQYATISTLMVDALVVGLVSDKSTTLVCVRPNSPVDFSGVSFGAVSFSPHTLAISTAPNGGGTTLSYAIQAGPAYPLTDGSLTADAWQRMVDAAYLVVRSQVQAVPGTGPVAGLFWMKDALYAARDYVAATATGIASDLAAEDVLTATNFQAKVFSVSRSQDGSGTIVLHSVIGTLPTGDLKRATTTVATVTAAATSPGAGLYKATGARGSTPDTQSWTHQNLGYSLRFKAASVDFPSMNRLTGGAPPDSVVQATPWFVAGSVVSQDISLIGGTLPGVIQTGDGDTSCTSATNQVAYSGETGRPFFRVNNFGVADADVPNGSVLTGLELEITRRRRNDVSHNIVATDSRIWFEYAGSPKINVADTQTAWPSSYTAATYGGATNLLGCTNLTPALLKDSAFALFFEMYFTPFTVVSSPYSDGRVTMVRLRAHYVPPQPSFYVWNPSDASPSAVVLNIVKSYKDSGEATDSNAQGTMYVMVDGVPRAIHAGEQIRTMPAPGVTPDGGGSDGSTQVGTVDSELSRNFLDGSAAIAAAGSRYQHVTANFFASADFEAMHVVSGAGPAFLYDGYAFARILTGLPLEKETPRHVTVHQSRLFLGYPSGTLQYSAAGDPLDFSGVDGANEVGIASPCTGLYPLNGQTLAIFTRDNVQDMEGDVSAPTMTFIAPSTGCIEYTAKSSGIFLYTSNRGVETMGATPAYGNFDNESLSSAVGPWLSQRVQRSIRYEGADKSVSDALIVRNKQQYRLFFKDNKVLTATFLRPQEAPQYTIQTMPVLFGSLLAVTESTGRDRLFAATSTGYVYELDRGNRFDDQPITASFTLVVDDQKVAYKQKVFTDAGIHGIATDYATFNMARAPDYEVPTATTAYPQVFNDPTTVATGQPSYCVSFTQINLMGRSVSFRFDVSTAIQPPVTIQAVSYNANPIGDKRT